MIVRINTEHTLVRSGGRDSHSAVHGQIPISSTSNESYLVRLYRHHILQHCHLVLDYSYPNIINTATSSLLLNIPHLYIAPLLFTPQYTQTTHRSIPCLTTFIDMSQPRRQFFFQKLFDKCPTVQNCNSVFDNEHLRQLYLNTKIVVNIHQTDHHHTFEELRVLPALLCGVIVISEQSPLLTSVPYHKHVLWCETFDDIIAKVLDVTNNYDEYLKTIFNDSFREIVEELQNHNRMCLQDVINVINHAK